MEENKAVKWFFDTYSEQASGNHLERLAINECKDYPEGKKRNRKVKQFITFIHEMFASYGISSAYFHKKTIDEVNGIGQIDWVVLGIEIGKTGTRQKPMMIILSGHKVHVLVDTPMQSALGLIGLVGSMINEKAKPFTHKVYDVQEFVDTLKIGEAYTSGYLGWDYAKLFKKYDMTRAFRPAVYDFEREAQKALKLKQNDSIKTVKDENHIKGDILAVELRELKKLFEEELITEEEYKKKKASLLGVE